MTPSVTALIIYLFVFGFLVAQLHEFWDRWCVHLDRKRRKAEAYRDEMHSRADESLRIAREDGIEALLNTKPKDRP